MILNDDELERYARQVVMPEIGEEGQKRLCDSHVAIIGLGGLGAPVIMALAGAGIGRLSLIDDDDVSLSNLNRQFVHSTQTLGLSKIQSAAAFIHSLNPDITLHTHHQRFDAETGLTLLGDVDIVIDCSDLPATRYAVNACCIALQIPLVFGGAVRTDGQVTSFLPADEKSPCFRCLFPEAGVEFAQAPACAQAGILGTTTMVIGALQAAETIRILIGFGESLCGTLLLYDGLNASFTPIKAQRAPHGRFELRPFLE
jgi:adenylyltransferase/sulfurtransferase